MEDRTDPTPDRGTAAGPVSADRPLTVAQAEHLAGLLLKAVDTAVVATAAQLRIVEAAELRAAGEASSAAYQAALDAIRALAGAR